MRELPESQPNAHDPLASNPQYFHGEAAQLEYIGPSSIEVEFTVAATKSADIGYSVQIEGDVDDARIDKAVRAATRAAVKMMESRNLLRVIASSPDAIKAAKQLLGVADEEE